MSRNLTYVIAMSLVSTVIIAVMIFGIGTAFSVMFLGGLADILADYRDGIWDMNTTVGLAKVACSGPVALLSVWVINSLLNLCDWLGRWKVGKA